MGGVSPVTDRFPADRHAPFQLEAMPVLDFRSPDPTEEARRTAALLEAVACETERIGQRQSDPALRRALLDEVARARADAEAVRIQIDTAR